jgi:dTDP-4-dehydrorhamnose 3,5-epimerase
MDRIAGILLTPLKIIGNSAGNIQHAMKMTDDGYAGFGEAYFSNINKGAVKGWKKHHKMILNLIVPVGKILFVLFDDRPGSISRGTIMQVELSQSNYQRLTVPPGIWMAFCGTGDETNILLNIASIPHDPDESENLPMQNNIINFTFPGNE